MEKGRIEFSISFDQPEWNFEQNGNVQMFSYINSNCVISKTVSQPMPPLISEPKNSYFRMSIDRRRSRNDKLLLFKPRDIINCLSPFAIVVHIIARNKYI